MVLSIIVCDNVCGNVCGNGEKVFTQLIGCKSSM